MRRLIAPISGVVGFLALYELVGRSGIVNPEFVPPPSVVLARLAQLAGDPSFVADLLATVLAWVIAMVLAIVIAVPLGFALGSIPVLRRATSVVVEFIRPVPTVALIPLVIVLIGSGPQAKIALAVFASVWPILFNVMYALHEVDPRLLDSARSFRTPRWRVFTSVKLPSVAPFAMTGVRLASAICLIVIISTELLASGSGGLGHFIYLAGSGSGRMDLVFAGTAVAGIFGALINAGLDAAQRRWLSWGPGDGST